MFLFTRVMTRAPQVMLTLVVFSLASGILGGLLFYADTVGPLVFGDMTSEVTVDMSAGLTPTFYQQTDVTVEDLSEIMLEQDGVVATESVAVMRVYDWDYYYESPVKSYLGIEDSFMTTFPGAIHLVSQPVGLGEGECYVQSELMESSGLDIGDNMTVDVGYYDEWTYEWTTVNDTYVIVGAFTSGLLKEYSYYDQSSASSLMVVTTRQDLMDAFGNVSSSYTELASEGIWIRLDHDLLIRTDPGVVSTELDAIRKRIEQRTLPYAYIGDFALNQAVSDYSYWALSLRAVSVAFSLPTLVMGLMLIHYSNDLLAYELKRDLGTIKTRGASGRQALYWVMGSALFTAFIGSLGAIGVGVIASLLSTTVRTFFEFDLSQLSALEFFLSPTSVALVFSFSFVVGTVASVPAAVKALTITPTEAHAIIESHDVIMAEKMNTPAIEVIAFGISAYILIPIFAMMAFIYGSVAVFASMMILMLPLMAVFILTSLRIMSRPASRVKTSILHRWKKSVGAKVLSRSAFLRKKSEAIGVMFIALVFTAGLFATISSTTGYEHMTSLYKFNVGADVTLEVKEGLHNVTSSFVQNITSVEGVKSAAALFATEGVAIYDSAQYYPYLLETYHRVVQVYGVGAGDWLESGFWLPYFTYYSDPATALLRVAEDNASVITSFKPVLHVEQTPTRLVPTLYDNISVLLNGITTDCTIVDTLSSSGGYEGMTYATYFPGIPDASDFVIMNMGIVHELLNTTEVTKFYVGLEQGANYTEVMSDLASLAPDSFGSIECSLALIDGVLQARAGKAVYGVYTLDVLFSLIYLTAGMAIVSSMRVMSLRKQLAILRALGADTTQLTVAILADAGIAIALGAAMGSLLGAGLGYIVSQMPLVYMGAASGWTWYRLPVILTIPWLMLVGIISAALAGSLVTTFISARRGLSGSIAEQIQYTE